MKKGIKRLRKPTVYEVAMMLIALFSLYVSWQAKNLLISSSNVVVIDSQGHSGGQVSTAESDRGSGVCSSELSLLNLGGSRNKLQAFAATVQYQTEQLDIPSNSTEIIRDGSNSFLNGSWWFRVISTEPGFDGPSNLSNEGLTLGYSTDYYLNMLPIEIESNSITELLFFVEYTFSPKEFINLFTYQSDREPSPGKHPILITYKLFFSDGQIIESPPVVCEYLRLNLEQ